MVDANLLKQLEDSLNAYQENQETLDTVVRVAQSALGSSWINQLPTVFDDASMPEEQKKLLKDKANHAVHYYGALLAWQEAGNYLQNPQNVTIQILEGRISTIEYWLSLFGQEGAVVVERLKALYVSLKEKETNVVNEENVVLPQSEEVSNQNNVVQPVEQNTSSVLNEEALTEQHEEENHQSSLGMPEVETTSEQNDFMASNSVNDTFSIVEENNEKNEVVVDTPAVLQTGEVAQISQNQPVEETILGATSEATWVDMNTDGEKSLDNYVDLEVQPSASNAISQEEFLNPAEVMQGGFPVKTQNWDFATFLRQKRLYDEANNWLSAWCLRMDDAEKTDYPHYGFIVDLMHDLKEKTLIVLENQLLEDLVDVEIPGGRASLERLVSSLEKEIEDLPIDFQQSTSEKIKLNAREILGAIDTSNVKEEMDAAPDGFELMDDPYAASTEQILSDFEKTEQEAQNEIDKLNVIEDNEDKQQKKDG